MRCNENTSLCPVILLILKITKRFTDVVHTSAGKFGISGTVGDADFWVNGGETQNGCTAKKSIQDFLGKNHLFNDD